jgi:hypothetical protein
MNTHALCTQLQVDVREHLIGRGGVLQALLHGDLDHDAFVHPKKVPAANDLGRSSPQVLTMKAKQHVATKPNR